MNRVARLLPALVAGFIFAFGAAQAARAADTVIATVVGPTTLDAYGGRVVWSQWDPAVGAARLMEHTDGATRAVPIRPDRNGFDLDLGPGPSGTTIAVYSRCRDAVSGPFALDGLHGCDLYTYDFTARTERRLRAASSRHGDEYAPAVWRKRLAFARMYEPRRGEKLRAQLYWRHLNGSGASRRLRQGPPSLGGIPEDLDMRGRRVAFFWAQDYGGYLRLAATTGSFRHLVTVPGSGAAAVEYGVHGVSTAPGYVYWMLRDVTGETSVAGEIWREDLSVGATWRATARLSRFSNGFAQDGTVSYYVRPSHDGPCVNPTCQAEPYDIHRLDGLAFEPAPPLELK